jgi:hypothetical protein
MSRLWILVVDDQEPVRDLIADILVADGHDVRTPRMVSRHCAYWVSKSTT